MTKRRISILVACVLLSIVVVVMPTVVRLAIEQRYSFIKIERASYIWGGLRFENIYINNETVDGFVSNTEISIIKKAIFITDGNATITISGQEKKKNASNKLSNWSIYAKRFKVFVSRQNIKAKISDLSYTKTNEKNEIEFNSAEIQYSGYNVQIVSGKASPDFEHIKADKVITNIALPFKIPELNTQDKLELHSVSIENKRKITIKSFNYGVFYGELAEIDLDNLKEIEKNSDADKTFGFHLKSISIEHKWFGKTPVIFSDITAFFKLKQDIATIFVGNQKLRIDVDIARQTIASKGECSDWISAMPEPRPSVLNDVAKEYTGSMDVFITIKPKPDFKLKESCSFRCSKSPIKDLFSTDGFKYTAYHPDGTSFERNIGQNNPDWISIDGIPPQLILAVTTLEDPGFFSHRGIIPEAIKNSLLANLQTGKFSRGGSTITMQLAKNIWLNRNKTLLRKANEAMLTFALESCLNKEQILELYLNVVEFGPNIYGIGPATKYYFKKMPSELSMNEAFFLAMILPRPNKAPDPANGGLLQAQGLISLLSKNGSLISTEQVR